MYTYLKIPLFIFSIGISSLLAGQTFAQVPETFTAPNETVVVTLHAEGAQIYES
jgi:hypothetical protein